MRKAARAIIIEDKSILVMRRLKQGSEYYTLVGGALKEGETLEQAVTREVREETNMDVVSARLVYIEHHAAPHNEQYILLCEVAPHGVVAVQETSEEGIMNRRNVNVHQPMWVTPSTFTRLHFRTPQLQRAILQGLQRGFPKEPLSLSASIAPRRTGLLGRLFKR